MILYYITFQKTLLDFVKLIYQSLDNDILHCVVLSHIQHMRK